MGGEFGTSLAEAQKAELEAMISFHHLEAAKIAEIAAATKEKEGKETELAELGRKVAEAKEDLEATKETLSEDEKFLVDLEKMCTTAAEEYAGRVKIRSEEIRALHETIAILTDDDARDLFGKTLSFLQLAGSTQKTVNAANAAQRQRMDKALMHIFKVAGKNKDYVLAALAIRTRLDKFTKVREIMDKMVAYENAIKVLESDIEALKSDIADMEISLKRAGEDRKAENMLFQSSVADSRATTNIADM